MRRAMLVLTAVGIVMLCLPPVSLSTGPLPRPIPDGTSALWMVRSLRMDRFGIQGPIGMAYVQPTDSFMILSGRPGDAVLSSFASMTLLTPHAERAGGFRIDRAVSDPTNAAFDLRTRRLLLLDGAGGRIFAVRPNEPGRGITARTAAYDISHFGLVDPRGMTVDPATGTMFILDAGRREILRVTPEASRSGMSGVRQLRDGRISFIDLRRADIPDLQGIAFNPADGHLYVASPSANALYELTLDGEIERFMDLSSLELRGLRALVFAPSVDTTDDPAIMDLYIVDSPERSSGPSDDEADTARAGGRLVEVSLTPPDRIEAVGSTFRASLVRTIQTSRFSPPSPDAMGLTYDASTGSLVETDSEVEEMRIYAGVNVYEMSLTGVLRRTYRTKFSNEPSGIAVNTRNGHWIFSDDDAYKIYDVDLGSDRTFGTSDDRVTSFSASSLGDRDPEDVAYDPVRNHLVLADGDGAEVWDIAPGPNGRFEGGGDDTVTHFDTARYGLRDPEGVAVNPVTGTIYISSRDAHFILETTPGGTILTTIDTSVIPANRPSGIVCAPSSTDASVMHLYTADRGTDNDSDPSENDGRIFEITLPNQASGSNRAPFVDAGPDQTIVLPTSASLQGSVSDDGLPSPGSLSVTWSKASGPGSVSFGNSHQAATSAGFTSAGTYVLRLTASDGVLSGSADVTITTSGTISGVGGNEFRVSAGSDDAEESSSGSMSLTSGDLELVHDSTDQRIGIRFGGVAVARGATITSAYIQFETDEAQPDATLLKIQGQSIDNAPTFTSSANNVSGRARTLASADWSPSPWATVGETGAAQRTPDLSAIIQEIVNRPGWVSGNSLAIIITGSGHRTAVAYDGDPAGAPILHVETGSSASNQAPSVDGGSDQTITLPATAPLAGSVTDDGLPAPASLTTTWSKVSGPGNVSFADSHQLATNASFTASGTYVLRLTADDGAMSGSDSVTIVVNPVGAAGLAIDVRVASSADDAEEQTSGAVNPTSSDLELVHDGSDQRVGIRFRGIAVPQGALITAAYVQFQTDEAGSGSIALTVAAQRVDDAPAFTTASSNISSRSKTTATAAWSPIAWGTVGAHGSDQRTRDLSAILQEVVSQPGWASGQAVVIIITGTGHRTAVAYDGSAAAAPLLHVEYQ